MAQQLSDEEQLQILKNWWNENGRMLMSAVVLGLGVYFGWQWWMQHEKDYAEGAAAIYTELSDAVDAAGDKPLSEDQQKTANFLIEQLQNDYARSIYAANASLLEAKLAVQNSDLEKAEAALNKALTNDDKDIQAITKLRLAKVYLAQEKYDDALKLVTYDQTDAYTSLYAALRGDILVAKGDKEAAKTAYQKALESLEDSNILEKRLLEIKLSDLPGAGEAS